MYNNLVISVRKFTKYNKLTKRLRQRKYNTKYEYGLSLASSSFFLKFRLKNLHEIWGYETVLSKSSNFVKSIIVVVKKIYSACPKVLIITISISYEKA